MNEQETFNQGNNVDENQNKTPKEISITLEGLGFDETKTKQDLWRKQVDDETTFWWDFRKNKKGNCWCNRSGHSIPEDEMKQMDEYAVVRGVKTKKPTEKKKTEAKKETPSSEIIEVKPKQIENIRGTSEDITRMMNVKKQLDAIVEASPDKKRLGEGMLWHELKFKGKSSLEPSAELVDMIALDMGHIKTEIVDFGTNVIEDWDSGEMYHTYFCVVKATDEISGTTGLGTAEGVIDTAELSNNKRTFARTNVIRKAERNSKERLIPVPRKAMVVLIQRILQEHYNKSSKK